MYSTPPLHYSYWDDALSVSRQAYVVALGIWNPERGSYSTIAHYKNKESLRLLIQQQDTIYVPDRYNKRNKGDLDARYYPEEVSSAYNIFDESESAETADKRIVRQERYEMVMRHVNALPKHQREAVLGWMSEKKFREIGNVSKQATNKNFLKALRKLREDPIIRSLMY